MHTKNEEHKAKEVHKDETKVHKDDVTVKRTEPEGAVKVDEKKKVEAPAPVKKYPGYAGPPSAGDRLMGDRRDEYDD